MHLFLPWTNKRSLAKKNMASIYYSTNYYKRIKCFFLKGFRHRVAECLAFSLVVGIGTPPTLHPHASGAHSLARKGLGESQFQEGTYTVVLFKCTHFVVSGLGSDRNRRWGQMNSSSASLASSEQSEKPEDWTADDRKTVYMNRDCWTVTMWDFRGCCPLKMRV
jgi:hypothetical protein